MGRLDHVTLLMGPGVHAVMGQPEDGTAALCELVSGRRRPRLGVVTVCGRDPVASPKLRRRVGVLLPNADLPPVASVAAALELMERCRGVRLSGALAELGLQALESRAVSSLRSDEARAVELAVALSLPRPVVIVLHEPLTAVAHVDRDRVRQRIRDIARDGVCVIVTTSVPADVDGLADHVHLLDRGHLVDGDADAGGLGDGAAELTLWLAEDAARLRSMAAALGQHPDLSGVTFETNPAIVWVRGSCLGATSLAVADVVAAHGVRVTAMQRHTPPLDQLQAEARRRRERLLVTVDLAAPTLGTPSVEQRGPQP